MLNFDKYLKVIDEADLTRYTEAWPAPYALYLGELLGEKDVYYPVGLHKGNWVVYPALASWMQSYVGAFREGVRKSLSSLNASQIKHQVIDSYLANLESDAKSLNAIYTPYKAMPEDIMHSVHESLQLVLVQTMLKSKHPELGLADVSTYTYGQGVSYLLYLFDQLKEYRPQGWARLWKRDRLPTTPETVAVVQNIEQTLACLRVMIDKVAVPSSSPESIEGFYSMLYTAARASDEGLALFSDFGWSMELPAENAAKLSKVAFVCERFLRKLEMVLQLPEHPAPMIRASEEVDETTMVMAKAKSYFERSRTVLNSLIQENPYLSSILYGVAVQHTLLTWITSALFQYNLLLVADEPDRASEVLVQIEGMASLLDTYVGDLIKDDAYWTLIHTVAGRPGEDSSVSA